MAVVEIWWDGALRAASGGAPAEWSSHLGPLAAGEHALRVVARDRVGNEVEITRSVTVVPVPWAYVLASVPPSPP